jgi:hypothetical protein
VGFAAGLELREEGGEAGDDAWGSQDDGGCGEEKEGEEQEEDSLPDWGASGRQCEGTTVHLLLDSGVNLEGRGVRNASLIAGKLEDLGETSNGSGQSVRRLAGHVVRRSSGRTRQGRKRQEEAGRGSRIQGWALACVPNNSSGIGLVMSGFGG